MSWLLKKFYSLQRQWFWLALVLIVAIFVVTWIGMKKQSGAAVPEIILESLKLLVFSGSRADSIQSNVYLVVGRWLGVLFFFSGVTSVVTKLFAQAALVRFTQIFACKHVIFAGLGKPEQDNPKLVKTLIANGKSVVIIEPDANHPSVLSCKNEGAVVLIGSPNEPSMLKRARIRRAESVVLLSGTDRENTSLAQQAFALLQPASHELTASSVAHDHPFRLAKKSQVGCMLGITEPSLVDVIRQSPIYTNSNDHLRLNIFCVWELLARAMLRESRLLDSPRPLERLLIIGLGDDAPLGETLAIRAAKDWQIDQTDNLVARAPRLVIDIVDEHSDKAVACLTSRIAGLHAHPNNDRPSEAGKCFVRSFPLPANRIGFRSAQFHDLVKLDEYDAIMICLADEGMAVRHALELKQRIIECNKEKEVPIVVRVMKETSGFAPLLMEKKNIIPIGVSDRLQDILLSLNPEIEMLAQAIHQQYLQTTDNQLAAAEAANDIQAVRKLRTKPARASWYRLDESYRQSNRDQATRLSSYVEAHSDLNSQNARFQLRYLPTDQITSIKAIEFPYDELTRLAKREHDNWLNAQLLQNWKFDVSITVSDPIRKRSPFLIPWEALDQPTQQYDIDVIARLPFTFARANYQLEPLPYSS
jgi:hypothetical protein